MSQSKLDSFPKFTHLANELQDLVWEWSLKDRPPAAYFAQLECLLLVSRDENGKTPAYYSHSMMEDLMWADPPLDLTKMCPHRETQLDLLLRTCKRARRVAIRYRDSWGPEGTLQLLDPRDETRTHTLDFSRDFRPPPAPAWGARSLHFQYKPPSLLDMSSRKLDNSRDLVIFGHQWIGIAQEFLKTSFRAKPDWQLPIPRVPYLALTYTTRFHEFLDSQLPLVSFFLRLRTEVLYILINPDEFDDDRTAVTTEEAIKKVKARRKALETPFPKRKNAEALVANAPERFWYGPREYYPLTWDEMEDKMMNSAPWRQLAAAMEKARQMEEKFCNGCGDLHCNRRTETFPVVWKVMTWRDHEELCVGDIDEGVDLTEVPHLESDKEN